MSSILNARAQAESQVTAEQQRQSKATQTNVNLNRESVKSVDRLRGVLAERAKNENIITTELNKQTQATKENATASSGTRTIISQTREELERTTKQREREKQIVREQQEAFDVAHRKELARIAERNRARQESRSGRLIVDQQKLQEAIRKTQEIERAANAERLRQSTLATAARLKEQARLSSQAQLPGEQGRDSINLARQINAARARQPEIIKQISNSETTLQQLRESFFRKRDALNSSVNTQEQRILREQLGYLKNAIRERDKGLQQLREEQRAIEANTKALENSRRVLALQSAARFSNTPQRTATPQLDVERFAAGVERQRQQELDRSRLSVENLSKAIGNYNNQLKRNQSELNKTRRGQKSVPIKYDYKH